MHKAESMRDSFANLVVLLATKAKIQLDHVLSFPITQYPLAIAHSDGQLLKTTKSKLSNMFETYQTSNNTSDVVFDAALFDGGFVLHSYLSSLGRIANYGSLAKYLLNHIMKQYKQVKEVHVCFDTYSVSSLKFHERERRGQCDSQFHITGAEQAPQQTLDKLLRNSSFKDELCKFLQNEWQKPEYQIYLGNKTLFVSYGGYCVKIASVIEVPPDMQGSHDEADTLIAFHASLCEGNLVVRATDTDVMIILIGMLYKHTEEQVPVKYQTIIMDTGVGNCQRFVHLSKIYHELETHSVGIYGALIAFHSLTGSDYTSAFYRKGKVSPFKLLMNELNADGGESWLEAFKQMTSRSFSEEEKIENFVCAICTG